MPFSKVEDFERSFPAVKELTAEQKSTALEVFNSCKDAGEDDEASIKKALDAAKKLAEETFEFLSEIRWSEVSESQLENTEFEILRVGKFHDSRYGTFPITTALLHELVNNFNQNVLGTEVAVDVNHDSSKGAISWIKTLRVMNNKVLATLKDYSEEGKKLFREKIFKYFSVEFSPLEKVDESTGRKVTIKNVLRGLAVTNRPVIKGMRPAFFSEDINLQFNVPILMENFKLFAELLGSKKSVTKEEVSTLKAMHAKLSEDEQKQTQSQVTDAEKKVADEAAAEAKAKEEADAKAKADAEAGANGGVSAAEFAELKRQNGEKDKRLAQLELAEHERENTKRVEGLMLSEAGIPGFTKNAETIKALSEFVSTLTPAQYVQFSELVGKVSVVSKTQLSELGHGQPGAAEFADKQEAEKDFTAKAKKYAADNKCSLREAMLAMKKDESKK